MKAPQTLRRPANWQDFESLCKRLWGEIWNCPEIQKNGRLGQEQFGVDIVGMPLGEDSYYGIQCKGKSEYNDAHRQFTEPELLEEIEKVKSFTPPLKKLYFATTALSDSVFQTFVRRKNLEHKNAGLFEIHLYCWEAIVDLIDENKQTHDWYVKHQGYKTSQQVDVTFHDGTKELTIQPMFRKVITKYASGPESSGMKRILRDHGSMFANGPMVSMPDTFVNQSFCKFDIRVANPGRDPIENYALFFQFEGELRDLSDTNEEGGIQFRSIHEYYSTTLDPDSKSGKAVPRTPVLVGDDTFVTDEMFIKPLPKNYSLIVKWKLVSRDFRDNGELKINVDPQIKEQVKTEYVNSSAEIKDDEVAIKDSVVKKR